MLDMRRIREEADAVRRAAEVKGCDVDVDRIVDLDAERRELVGRAEALKAERNAGSKEVGKLRKAGGDASELQARIRAIGGEIKELDAEVARVTEERDRLLSWVPNVPAEDVPVGPDESANELVREWGEPREFAFEPRPHWEVGGGLGIIDLERGSKLAGSGFALYRSAGARLERALWSFMLELHTAEHGYTEVFPPYLASRECMFGTGQLPRLEEDMYRVGTDDLFLIPTAEVPVTNMHRGEIIPGAKLPLAYAAYTACFRREAGAYGAATRGMIRVHQFDKVELVRFVRPETSYDELELLVGHAEEVLRRLGLPYRVMKLATGELSFAAAKCYDIEVWAPGVGRHLEVSSCSNYEDFQARRAGIRFREPGTGKSAFLHTLNGSGVALPRVVVAILETFQEEDGSVVVPEVLRPYMGGLEAIRRE